MNQLNDNLRMISSGPVPGRLHPEINSAATRQVADQIARALEALDANITAVACWMSPENLILTFAVAETLGLSAVYLSEDEGLLYLSWDMPAARVGLIAASSETPRKLQIAAQALAGSGHTCVAVAKLTQTDDNQDEFLTVRTLDASDR